MTDHEIKARTEDGIWLIGTADGCPFQAKVRDAASGFGIDQGRIIKLHAYDGRGQEIFSFERGWDECPEGAHEGLCQALVRFCESLPAQDIWRNTFRTERRFLVTDDDVLECGNDGV